MLHYYRVYIVQLSTLLFFPDVYTLFFNFMILIYPKKCEKSNESKKKVVDLGCTRRFHFF